MPVNRSSVRVRSPAGYRAQRRRPRRGQNLGRGEHDRLRAGGRRLQRCVATHVVAGKQFPPQLMPRSASGGDRSQEQPYRNRRMPAAPKTEPSDQPAERDAPSRGETSRPEIEPSDMIQHNPGRRRQRHRHKRLITRTAHAEKQIPAFSRRERLDGGGHAADYSRRANDVLVGGPGSPELNSQDNDFAGNYAIAHSPTVRRPNLPTRQCVSVNSGGFPADGCTMELWLRPLARLLYFPTFPPVSRRRGRAQPESYL